MDELTITALVVIAFALVCCAAALWVVVHSGEPAQPAAPQPRTSMSADAWRVVHEANRSGGY